MWVIGIRHAARMAGALSIATAMAFGTAAAQHNAVFPAASWQRITNPDSAGWAREDLERAEARLSQLATTGFMAVVDGRVLLEYGDVHTASSVQSIRKSILSMLFGQYVTSGTVRLDKTLAQIGIDDIGGLTAQEREATIGDLLTARSGVFHPASNGGDDLASAPPRGSKPHGTYQLYSNWDFNALGTIFERETGRDIYDAFATDLARPLGMQDFDRDAQRKVGDATQSVHLAYPMQLSTRDMARIGYLMLREGNWNGRQLVPRDWVALTTRVITPGSQMNPDYRRGGPFGYGHMWWVWDSTAASGPFRGAYTGVGMFGQFITVLPAVNLVIAHKSRSQGIETTTQQYLEVVNLVVRARCHVRLQAIEAWCAEQAADEARVRAIDTPVALTAGERAVYVGSYTFRFQVNSDWRTLVIHVAEEDGRLMAWAQGKSTKSALIPLGNHTFGWRESPRSRLIFTVEGGVVVRVREEEPDEHGNLVRLDGVRTP